MANQHKQLAISRRSLLAAGAVGSIAGAVQTAFPLLARATELSEKLEEQEKISEQIVQLRLELERDADAYHKAIEEHDAANLAVEKAQAKIDANTQLIEALQEKLMNRMATQYRSDEMGLYDVLLDSADFDEFATRWAMIERLNEGDSAMVDKIRALRNENEDEKTALEEQENVAQQKMDEAKHIETECRTKITTSEKLLERLTEETEELIRRDQEEALSRSTAKVTLIGNPRNIEPVPEVVDVARSCMGIPYVWGGKGPNSFDCSGLVAWCYAQVGIGIPSYTESEYALALALGAVLPLSEVMPGDVLYRPGHVGIAAHKGGVPYIHAPHTGAVVRDTDTLAYAKFVCGLRFPRNVSITYISESVADYREAASTLGYTNITSGTTASASSSLLSGNSPLVSERIEARTDDGETVSIPVGPTIQTNNTSVEVGSAAYNGFDED